MSERPFAAHAEPEASPLAAFPGLREPSPALAGFHDPVKAWFTSSFAAATRPQELGWPAIQAGQHTLILAPTGTGKTLSAFLVAIDHLMFAPVPEKDKRCRVLYISPLKALAVDVDRNLRAPLVGIARAAERMGIEYHEPTIAVRTGDTPHRERAQFQRTPADILITTPESLYLMLTSQVRESLRSVQWIIIDEIHAMVNTKRGVHLMLSLERLEALVREARGEGTTSPPTPLLGKARGAGDSTDLAPILSPPRLSKERGPGGEVISPPPTVPQRIGLSATQRPLDEVARFLAGFEERTGPDQAPARPVLIVDAGSRKELDLLVEVPVEDMAKLGQQVDIPSGDASRGEVRTSIWPAMHPLILKLIREHRSTLIFVNSRRLAERLASALNELAGEDLVRAHHGSIAREQRLLIEDELKSGRLPAMVATSSLELGIDMGAIDLVIQVEAPPSVAGGLQRIGRAGHHVGEPSKGVILPKFRGDLLACAALTERMKAGAVEEMHYPRNPLDVLAQQIVAIVAMDERSAADVARLVRRAAPFAELPQSMFDETLDMLSGRYMSDDFAELRPRITWDRLSGMLYGRVGSKQTAIANAGTIPDRGLYGVFLVDAEKGKGRVGELDEEMVFETHAGDVFLLGASSWRVEEITHDRVLVSPAPGVPGKMPFWHGENAARPLEFGRAIGALTRIVRALPEADAMALLKSKHSLNDGAARNLLQYLRDQEDAAGAVPDDRTIVVESYQDEMGDWRVCILSPFGGKVHAPWAMAIGAMVHDRAEYEIDILWTDDGIVIRFPEADEPPPLENVIPDPDEVEDLVIRQLASTGGGTRQGGMGASVSPIFASRFREAAARALLLPRKKAGARSPLWQQRRKASELLQVTSKFGSFPIVLETFRECLRDIFDMPALQQLLREVRGRDVRVVPVTTRTPSPFAASLMFNYVSNFIYEGDAPLAERRAQALAVDPSQLRELLGDIELRELIDGDALSALELYLQHLTAERKARHADGLHDMLLRIGDLSETDVMGRVADRGEGAKWLERLARDRRVAQIVIAGEMRYIASEDAGRFRDSLGIPPPPGLPDAFLEYGRDPLGDIVARYARTHGPFHVTDIAARFGIGIAPVNAILTRMAADGKLVEGEFRPGATGREWCETGVLRALRQKSLAKLRQEVEPVEQAALGRFSVAWHMLDKPRKGPNALFDVIEQLQGSAIPASILESTVLPARLEDYNPGALDALLASGSVVWVGRESIGQHDGRVSLYLAEHLPLLYDQTSSLPSGELHVKIREHLAARGASFFGQITAAAGGYPPDVLTALWDLVWCGAITNDTFAPLRAFLRSGGSAAAPANAPGRGQRMPRMRHGRSPIVMLNRGSMARAVPADAAGRWSLVESFVCDRPSTTERLSATVNQLLERFGIVTRESIQAEGIPGGFSALYPVLKAMEDAGHVRRGYFVAGLGAAQFALPGAIDRLRGCREPGELAETVLLAAADPANPYGATLKWPGGDAENAGDAAAPRLRRANRSAGATVVLVDGAVAAWQGRGERNLVTYLDNITDRDPSEVAYEVAARLAAEVASGRRRSLYVQEVDGKPANESRMASAFVEAGFARDNRGYLKR
ncbi:MAG TPA: DEAD/DEAH box helicase [Capsulimonadaceae bacterium]|jgi:ATP-dependent Lhr-like helicase